MPFADGFHASEVLPLRHGVDGVDVVNPRLAILVALMNRVDAQESGLALRIGFAPFADVDLPARRVSHADPLIAVHGAVAQIVQMGHRDPGQSLVLLFAEYLELAAQNASQRRSGQILVGGIGYRQQHNVLALVSDREVWPRRRPPYDFPFLHPPADQPRQLGAAGGGDLLQEPAYDAFSRLAELAVSLRLQYGGDQRVSGLGVLRFPCHFPAARKQRFHLAQTELVQVLHAELHSSEASPVQALPALESS